jgi:hypothetical protein
MGHTLGHMASGFLSIVSAFLDSSEAADRNPSGSWSTPSTVVAVLGGVTWGAASILVPRDPIKNIAVAWIVRVAGGIRLLCKLIFSGPAQKKFKASISLKALAVSDGRGIGAIVDAVLVIPSLFGTCWHFYELSSEADSAARSSAIVDETSFIAAYSARVSYAVAVNTEGVPQAVAIGVMAVSDVLFGGMQIAESLIES